MDNETRVTFKYFQFFYTLIGLQKAKFNKTKAKPTSILYKTYASLFLLSMTIMTAFCMIKINAKSKMLFEHAVVVRAMNFLHISAVTLSMPFISIAIIFRDPKMICQMYDIFLKIDEFLEFHGYRDRSNANRKLFVCYLFFVVFKVAFMVVLSMCWPEFNVLFYNMSMLIIDSENMRFFVETNLLSRKIRAFNRLLKVLISKKITRRNVDSMKARKNKNTLYGFVCIHEKICSIADIINSCYGYKVCIIFL